MKHLIVKKISVNNVAAESIPEMFYMSGLDFHDVNCVDWPDMYSYNPKMSFAIAYTDNAILVHYRVEENCIRAIASHDNGNVWEDSCCEFFVQPVSDGTYYNIECNCAGTLLIGFGKDRNNRQLASQAVLDGIKRWSSLGRDHFDIKNGKYTWEMALVIPFTTFFVHEIKKIDGKTVRANFYKCGDKTSVPHFLSWNPIDTQSPDFHRPDFFGEMTFD
jgi:hypothetical protein